MKSEQYCKQCRRELSSRHPKKTYNSERLPAFALSSYIPTEQYVKNKLYTRSEKDLRWLKRNNLTIDYYCEITKQWYTV